MNFAVISRGDATDWALFIAAIGASIFSWGMGSYHQYRASRRKEDQEDRKVMFEDVRVHTKLICEMEAKQISLKKELDELVEKIEDARCRYPEEEGGTPCDSH